MTALPPGIYPIRGVMGNCHLLLDEKRKAILLDTGLVGEPFFIRRLLRRLQLEPTDIKAIVLTHGHLDHAGNLAMLHEWTAAPILAHEAEQAHIDGTYPYTGVNAWCGRLEAMGRALFKYRTAVITQTFNDGDRLPYWGGLEVMHLPGHTKGHCGFYSAKHDLFFTGDLFASYGWSIHLPPPILNSEPHLIPASMERVLQKDPRLVLPNHYDWADPVLHKKRFVKLCGKLLAGK